jgi:Nuclease-related domain
MGGATSSPDGWRVLRLRYPGVCELCGASLSVGTSASYDGARRKVRCQSCREVSPSPATPPVASGEAGRSANRQYERWADSHRREMQAEIEEDLVWRQKIKAEHPVLGRVVSALSAKPAEGPAPQKITAWKQGAEGERAFGRLLDEWASTGAGHVLHDRRVPRTRGNIDHIAISTEGVWVIDTKNYKGLVKVSLGVLRAQQLTINGRDKTELAGGVRWQMDQVAKALDASAAGNSRPPVRGVLCFVRADWPLFEGTSTIKGVTVAWPEATIKLLTPKNPPSTSYDLERCAQVLIEAFPPA